MTDTHSDSRYVIDAGGRCGHVTIGNGFAYTCDLLLGHKGWHEQRKWCAMTDTHSGSRRHDVWEELKAQTTDRIPNATARLATTRRELDELEQRLKAVFEHYEKTCGTLEEAGIVAQMKLSPMLSAAHGAWLRDRDVPRRLELSEVSEAPIPPEDAA